jgi:hypothetical protein
VSNQVITNWPPGAALWLVWDMIDSTGKAQGLAIDNLTFSANPENLTNTAPVMGAISNQSILAGTLLTFTATATDSDKPAQLLTYSLGTNAPPGAAITSGGVFSWMPLAAQAPSTNAITISVSDNGVPPLSDNKVFTVVVYRANTAPKLAAITNQTAFASKPLTFQISATDTDQPPQSLSFSLGPGAPAGAGITKGGFFSWTPTTAQISQTNRISIVVSDDGMPPLSDTNSFNVTVSQVLTLQASSSLNGPFTDDANAIIDPAQKTISAAIGSTTRLYRLRSDTALRIMQIQTIGNQVVLHYQ